MEQQQAQTIVEYVPVVALIVSVLSAVLATISYRRTAQFQDAQIAPRVQVTGETVYAEGPGSNDALSYEAWFENCGQHAVRILSVEIGYGVKDDPERQLRHSLEPAFYLPVKEKRKIQFRLDKADFVKALDRIGRKELQFWLKVGLKSPKGIDIEATRPLVTIGDATIFQANASDILA